MEEQQFAALVKRTLWGYAFFLGLGLAFVLVLGYSMHELSHLQQEYQQTKLQEELLLL